MMPATVDARESVLYATHLLDRELASELHDACQKVGLALVSWSGEPLASPPPCEPVLIVGGLKRGERRVPDDLHELIESRFPNTPLLLLCQDKLLRPQMSLHSGRVTLLGPPLVGSRIRSALRTLLSERNDGGSTDTLRGVAVARTKVAVQRIERTQWWCGAIATPRSSEVEATLPLLHHRRQEGLVALLPPAEGERPEALQLAHALHLLRDPGRSDLESALEEALGDVSMVHLSPGEREWVVYWPEKTRPLWLYSALRLPALWRLRRSFKRGKLLRMRASGADLLLAANAVPPLRLESLLSEESDSIAEARETELAAALALGGAGAFQFVETSVREHPVAHASSAAILVEVR